MPDGVSSHGGSPPEPRRARFFLSYSRRDEERTRIAAEIHAALAKKGSVWWDQVDMPGRGLTFLQEIRDAIEGSDRLVLLLGPGAARSDYVRAEWQYALVATKVVNPILIDGNLDLLPAELKNLDCPDASTPRKRPGGIAQLVRELAQPVPPLGPLRGPVPELPPHFQPRPDEVSALADRALADTRRPVVVKPSERITVVHGMPGTGKSALAAAFARSIETRRAFVSGVLWVAAGRSATAESVAAAVCAAAGEAAALAVGRRDAVTRLRGVLEASRYLVVLDDVWSIEPIVPFLDALGTRSRLVVTTRMADYQSSLGALGLLVGPLDEAAALRHLADWSGSTVDELPAEARRVARECGYLPLALSVCGALAQDGLPWADLRANLQAANLGFLQKRLGRYPYTSLLRAMSVSLDHLARERKDAVARYRELAVFPSSAPIPATAVATLWSGSGRLSESETHRLLVTLQGRSLLRLMGPGAETVTLHDLQWDFLSASARDRRRLHRLLLAAYRARFPQGFETAPEGDYIVDHAGLHLEQAGELRRLYALVDRSWFERKFSQALRRSFLDDAARVVEAARGRCPRDLAPLVRACLVRSTVASLAVEAPPTALYVLARCGRGSEALDAALLSADPRRRVELCSHVASGLRARGLVAEAKALALQTVEIGQEIADLRAGILAWAALLLAEAGDSEAGTWIDRSWAAASSEPRASGAGPMALTALAAFKAGRLADARRMMEAAERAAGGDEALADVGEGWVEMGELARVKRLVRSRLEHHRRHWAPPSAAETSLLPGRIALACARAGHAREAQAFLDHARPTSWRRNSDPNLAWAPALVTARLGRAGEAERWIRRAVSGRDPRDRHLDEAERLAEVSTELAAGGHRERALAFARRSLDLLRAEASDGLPRTIDRAGLPRRRAGILSSLAETLAECRDEAGAVALARQALVAATSFRWDARRIGQAEGAIAEAFAASGAAGRARDIAAAIEDDYAREEAYEKLARAFALGGRLGEAVEAARLAGRGEDDYAAWKRAQAIRGALEALPARAVARAARRLLPAIPDRATRRDVLCWLAFRLPTEYLELASATYAESSDPGRLQEPAVWLARALHRRGDRKGLGRMLDDLQAGLPEPKASERMGAIESVARLVTLKGQRDAAPGVIESADIDDREYGACALSRVAEAFLEAGWTEEAKSAAARGASRVAQIGPGQPHGTADACLRLARVLFELGDRTQALGFAGRALATLANESGSSSAFPEPPQARRAAGALLGERLEPPAALRAVLDAVVPEPDSKGLAADALLGLLEAVLDRRGVRAARRLEEAVEASRAGYSPWLRARVASLAEQRGDVANARRRLAEALALSSKGDAGAVLDVIACTAGAVARLDRGRTLRRVYEALVEIQGWSTTAGGTGEPRPAPSLVSSWR